MNAASRPTTAISTQPKARGVRTNCLSITTVVHAMNLARTYATPATRLPTRAVCSAPFIYGAPVKWPFAKPNTAKGQQRDSGRDTQRTLGNRASACKARAAPDHRRCKPPHGEGAANRPFGIRLFQSQLEAHHEIAPRFGLAFKRGDDGRTFLGRHPTPGRYPRFPVFRSSLSPRFLVFRAVAGGRRARLHHVADGVAPGETLFDVFQRS